MSNKGDKKKILIAESSSSVMDLLESALEAEGYEVFRAATGEKATELLASSSPDLILMNIEILDLCSPNTLAIYNEKKRSPAIPMIFITALNGTMDTAKLSECGAVDYITQPIDRQQLSEKVRNHLAIKRLRDELSDADRQLKQQIAGSKQVQMALAKAYDQLEAKMVHRMNAFKLAKQAAETANRIKETFLAEMSHEMRTPLNSIIGSAYLMMQSDLSPKQREQINDIKLSCDQMLSVMNDLLDITKIEAGQLQLAKSVFRLHPLVERIVAALTPKSQEKKLALSWHIEPQVPEKFIGAPTRLRQVLFNLIESAIQVTDSGKVQLFCREREETSGKTTLHFSVTGSGIGSSKKRFDQIFKRFAPFDGQTRARYGGPGSGLSIAKHLVELMEGHIWVESKPGSESSLHFTVKLPVHLGTEPDRLEPDRSGAMRVSESVTSGAIELSPKMGTVPPGVEKKQHPRAGRCELEILLVEDDWINRKMATDMLEMTGARVRAAKNGADALTAMEKHRFDLIFMDVQMPVMDGIETTRRIRERTVSGCSPIPIIAMTAHAMQGDSDRFLKAGMNDYIAKPVDPGILFEKVRLWRRNFKKREEFQMVDHPSAY
jgi:signal transduction histidine kinase